MSMLIQHHMAALNAERQFNIVTKAKEKKMEKLASGYRINRAADDAAGLSISEKMRRQIRGLKVGTENAEMGISWVQIGEGALNEAHDILHRMNELSIKAQNGTNTLTDRAYMEAEFEQLQNELDRISTTTTFNELNIFEEHEPVYDQISGNIDWDYEEYHEIRPGKNDLTITYRTALTDEAQVMTISVPTGKYTTHELIDAIDDAFGVDSPIHLELTDKGICKLNLEGGAVMDSVKGGLTYLLWDNYDGGGYGTLIGTTEFLTPDDELEIVVGQNDAMYVEWESFDPTVGKQFGWIHLLGENKPDGYTRFMTKADIMNAINVAIETPGSGLEGCGLKASDHGLAIQLSSDEGIVTGFKGNMFKIENTDPIYTSAFYDNIQYGHVWQDPASVVGGAVLTTDVRDEEHNRYYINSTNNKLVLNPNPETNSVKTPITITIPQKAANASDPTKEGYTAQEMVDELNKIFENTTGLKGEVKAYLVRSSAKEDDPYRDAYPDGKKPGGATLNKESVGDDNLIFEGIEIRTVKEGPDAIVNIDKDASTAYDTLFTIKNYNKYGSGSSWDATIDSESVKDYNAYSLGQSGITSSIRFTSANNKFNVTIKSTPNRNTTNTYDINETFTINIGTGSKNLSGIISAINADFKNHEVVVGKDEHGNDIKKKLSELLVAESDGNFIKIVDKEDLTLDNAEHKYPNWKTEVDLSTYESNAGYRILFQRKEDYTENKTYTYKGSVTLTPPNGKFEGPLTFYINGVPHTIGSAGQTPGQAKDGYYEETPIKFSTVESTSADRPQQNFTMSGQGTTTLTYWPGGSATGSSKTYQGSTRLEENTPATLAVGPASIPSKVTVDSSNNQITLGLNGKDYTFTLADSVGSAFDADGDGKYNQDELVDALQAAIDKQAGEGFGGAVVEIEDNQFVITSRVGNQLSNSGRYTSITSYAKGEAVNTFFESLGKTETAASCTSKLVVKDSIDLTTANDTFEFTFTDKKGNSKAVSFHLLEASESGGLSISKDDLIRRIDTKLKADSATKDKVEVSLDGSNHLVITTLEAGEKTFVQYTTGSGSSINANAKAIFKDIDKAATDLAAEITLNQPVRSTPYSTMSGPETFVVNIDGTDQTFYVQSWSKANNTTNDNSNLVYQLNHGIVVGGVQQKGLNDYGVTASISGGKLVLTKDVAGNDASGNPTSLKMSYGGGGSAMEYIFGKTPAAKADDVALSVSKDGKKIIIEALKPDGTKDSNAVINIDSEYSGGTLAGKQAVRYWDHVQQSGFHSAKFSTVTSVDLSDFVKDGGIELTRWNNELEFEFTENYAETALANPKTDPTWKKVSFRLTESGAGKKTSIDDIVKELQSKIDGALGTDKIEVLFDTKTNKLSLKSTKPGAQFQFRGMVSTASGGSTTLDATNKIGGGFFHHVMCKSEEQTKQLADPSDINGDQFSGDIFAQGRHDLVFDPAGLHPGMSDTLILDLNYFEDADHDGVLDADADRNGKIEGKERDDVKKITLTLHLDERTQARFEDKTSAAEVIDIMRQKIDEAIEDWMKSTEGQQSGLQLHKGLIEVDMGRHDTGVLGNKDKVSMSFTITKNPDIATPVEGYFYIDGIRGNAAYETFYYTEGDLIPGFIEGTKDISKGVVLGDNDKDLYFLVDGEMKHVDLSGLKKHELISASEIVHTISQQFKDQGLPLTVTLGRKGNLRISFDRMGKHSIEQVTGSAREELFFQESSANRLNKERDIRVSSFEGDRLSVYSPRFSTAMLGVNSICISTVKNAEKATNRLKAAIQKVSDMRSTFGAIQNRFEHTVNNNLNKHENLQAAESRIRDADMSNEMVDFSNLSIIQQAGQAILAQANQSRQGMLSLLG